MARRVVVLRPLVLLVLLVEHRGAGVESVPLVRGIQPGAGLAWSQVPGMHRPLLATAGGVHGVDGWRGAGEAGRAQARLALEHGGVRLGGIHPARQPLTMDEREGCVDTSEPFDIHIA